MHTKLLSAVALAATAACLAVPAAPALAAPVAARTSAASAHVPATLHWHDHGPSVARVQRILGLKATGTFDLHLLRAVQKFQRAHHIRPTGNVGPQTWDALLKVEQQHTASSAQARALAAAKSRAGAALSDLADALDVVGSGVDADSGPDGPLTGADAVVLNERLDRVDAHGAALSTALGKATAIGWVKTIGTRADHLIDVTGAIGTQAGGAIFLHPDRTLSLLDAVCDGLVEAAAQDHHPVDPARESAARTALLTAMRNYLTAAGPYGRQAWAIDPLGAGAPARIGALQAKADRLPQNQPLETATENYLKLFPLLPGKSLTGLRADAHTTRSHAKATLPTLRWVH
ncbi:MAG: peptidoglycan-binding domain-containing protein [Oryzihumus sp.]